MTEPGFKLTPATACLVAGAAVSMLIAAAFAARLAPGEDTHTAQVTASGPLGDYYASIPPDARGDALRSAVHAIIAKQRQLTYRGTWAALAQTDADPNAPGHVVLFYTGWSRSANPRDAAGNLLWNREHVWAQSRGGFGTKRGAGTDLHMLRPTDESTNGARGNLAFDDGGERGDRSSFEYTLSNLPQQLDQGRNVRPHTSPNLLLPSR